MQIFGGNSESEMMVLNAHEGCRVAEDTRVCSARCDAGAAHADDAEFLVCGYARGKNGGE